jgi:hypothetical protein
MLDVATGEVLLMTDAPAAQIPRRAARPLPPSWPPFRKTHKATTILRRAARDQRLLAHLPQAWIRMQVARFRGMVSDWLRPARSPNVDMRAQGGVILDATCGCRFALRLASRHPDVCQ